MPKIATPERFTCPISHTLIRHPVQVTDGYIYEEPAIREWVEKNKTSPMTRQTLEARDISRSIFYKNSFEAYLKEYNICTEHEFIAYVKEGNIEKLKQLLYLEDYLDYEDINGNNLLHIAAENSHTTVLTFLFNEGVKAIKENKQGECPIHIAVKRGNLEAVELLLSKVKEYEKDSTLMQSLLNIANKHNQTHLSEFLTQQQVKLLPKSSRSPSLFKPAIEARKIPSAPIRQEPSFYHILTHSSNNIEGEEIINHPLALASEQSIEDAFTLAANLASNSSFSSVNTNAPSAPLWQGEDKSVSRNLAHSVSNPEDQIITLFSEEPINYDNAQVISHPLAVESAAPLNTVDSNFDLSRDNVLYQQGLNLFHNGKFDLAFEAFKQVIDIKSFPACSMQGITKYRQKNYMAAIMYFEREQCSKFPVKLSYFWCAKAYFKCLLTYNNGHSYIKKQISTVFARILRHYPEDVDTLFLLVKYHCYLHNENKAKTGLEKLHSIIRYNPNEPNTQRYFYYKGYLNKSIAELQYSNRPEALRIIGDIYYLNKDFVKAYQHYQSYISALGEKKAHSLVYFLYGMSCFKLDKKDEARNHFRQAKLNLELFRPSLIYKELNLPTDTYTLAKVIDSYLEDCSNINYAFPSL